MKKKFNIWSRIIYNFISIIVFFLESINIIFLKFFLTCVQVNYHNLFKKYWFDVLEKLFFVSQIGINFFKRFIVLRKVFESYLMKLFNLDMIY